MKEIFNSLFYILKLILLVASFGLTLFILNKMSIRLENGITTVIKQLIPYGVLLIIFIINIIFRQHNIIHNVFYNLTCTLVLATISCVCLRSILDTNLILNEKYGYGIDFNFFDNFIPYVNIMLYGLALSNILFMFNKKNSRQKEA